MSDFQEQKEKGDNNRRNTLRWSKVKSESEVTQSGPTLCDPMGCSLPGSPVHGIFQARVLEWVAISFFRGSSRPRDQTWVSRIGGKRFTVGTTREVQDGLRSLEKDSYDRKFYYRQLSPFQSKSECPLYTRDLGHKNQHEKSLLQVI